MGRGPGPTNTTFQFRLFGTIVGLTEEDKDAIRQSLTALLIGAGVPEPITFGEFTEGSIEVEAATVVALTAAQSAERMQQMTADILDALMAFGGRILQSITDGYDRTVAVSYDTNYVAVSNSDDGIRYVLPTGANKKLLRTDWEDGDYTETSITQVIIPNGVVEEIDRICFRNCLKLNYIQCGNSIKKIGDHALQRTGLTGVVLPTNTEFTTIEEGVFNNCLSLKTIQLPNQIQTIGQHAFSINLENQGGLESITMPTSLTQIRDFAFQFCRDLKRINNLEQSSLVSIDEFAFQQCQALETFTFPDTVKTIGEYAFQFAGLTAVVLPRNENFLSIEPGVFNNCSALAQVTFADTNQQGLQIKTEAFSQSGLTSVETGNNVTVIGNNAFKDCQQLETVVYGKWVQSIGKNAFAVFSPAVGKLNKITFLETFSGGPVLNIDETAWVGQPIKEDPNTNLPPTNKYESIQFLRESQDVVYQVLSGGY